MPPQQKSTFVMVLDVPCETCGALPGEPCTFDHKFVNTHSVRVLDAYQETIKRQKESSPCLNPESESGGTVTSKATT